jgi:cytochrome c2
MNQVRHIVYACFLLFVISISLALIKFISTSAPAEKSVTTTNDLNQNSNPNPDYSPSYSIGQSLFRKNCQTCHALDKDLTGPALRGFMERGPWGDKKEIYKWIRNPAAYIKQNKYAASLQMQYGTIMQSFDMTDQEIDQIVNYIISAPTVFYMYVAKR